MGRSFSTALRPSFCFRGFVRHNSSARPPIIRIENGTFYRSQPTTQTTEHDVLNSRPLFPDLNFSFPTDNPDGQYWAIVGPSNAGKTTFLDILRGQYLCYPPKARSYPYLSTDELAKKDHRLRYPGRAIQYVGFNDKQRGLSGVGTYLSARYESRREITDFSLLDYLKGNTQLNAETTEELNETLLARVLQDLRLGDLAEMPLSNLSNGQSRRARIAKALLGKPEVLLLDEPFMGLDPPTMISISTLLRVLAHSSNPRLMLALRPQDPLPDWVTHILFLGENMTIKYQGTKQEVDRQLIKEMEELYKVPMEETLGDVPKIFGQFGRLLTEHGIAPNPERLPASKRAKADNGWKSYREGDRGERTLAQLGIGEANSRGKDSLSGAAYPIFTHEPPPPIGEPVIEMNGVIVKYGEKVVLGDWQQWLSDDNDGKTGLFWEICRGQRWGIFGPNGSGKTTLLSMITSDHPQSYSAPLKLFGRKRLPSRGTLGISLFELQARIGHSSPEVHAFFPRSLSVRATLESAWADAPLSRPIGLTVEADNRIDACLRWFQAELNPTLGTNDLLKEEALRHHRPPALEYSVPGNHEDFLEAQREFWYAHDTKQAASVAWADKMLFGELPFSAQRVALFVRAIVKSPDLVILDEAFSGMDDYIRDKCLLFLEAGESKILTPYAQQKKSKGGYTKQGLAEKERGVRSMRNAAMPGLGSEQALLCISHVKEEVPSCVRDWIYLPEAGKGEVCRIGKADEKPIRSSPGLWGEIWGMNKLRSSFPRDFML